MVKPSGAAEQNVTIAPRIESLRMADLEIKFNYIASKVVHVPFWYSETLVRTVLIFWMQSSSHLLKITSNRMTLICGDSRRLYHLNAKWYIYHTLSIKSRNMAD